MQIFRTILYEIMIFVIIYICFGGGGGGHNAHAFVLNLY